MHVFIHAYFHTYVFSYMLYVKMPCVNSELFDNFHLVTHKNKITEIKVIYSPAII